MVHDCLDFKYTYITDSKSGNTYHNINYTYHFSCRLINIYKQLKPCVGDNIVVSKLTSALKNQGNISFGWSHDQDWLVHLHMSGHEYVWETYMC